MVVPWLLLGWALRGVVGHLGAFGGDEVVAVVEFVELGALEVGLFGVVEGRVAA